MNLLYINKRGDTLNLLSGANYQLTNIDAQTSGVSDISASSVSSVDGDTVNSITAQPRTIVLDIRIHADVEKTKREILNIIKLKQKGTLRWTQEERTLEIKGYIEAIEMPRWNNEVTMQITIHCEQPFWEDLEETITEVSQAINLHYFTEDEGGMLYFTAAGIPLGEYDILRSRLIHNDGDVSSGLKIEIIAFSAVTNPVIYRDDGSFFGVGYGTGSKQVTMAAGDVITITTGKNEKSVKMGNTNLLGKVKPNSTWLQLEAGDNVFSINSDEAATDNMTFSLSYKGRYV